MSYSNNNPFVRGYDGLSVQRLLAISYDDDCPLTYLPLHPRNRICRTARSNGGPASSDDFVLITEDQAVPDELQAQCRSHGLARNLVYAVTACRKMASRCTGDTYSEEAAREVVRRLHFETGYYSRCWEISSAHLDAEAHRFLAELADIATPTLFLFVAFRIPYSPAIGLKLIATPWTDENLRAVEGITAKRLMQEHRKRACRIPRARAAPGRAADVRMLVFDADAQVLNGLPIYDE